MKIIICFLVLVSQLRAQDIDYARNVIDTLTSDYFAGRGVEGEGEKKASLYIADQFSEFGLHPINESFFQSFQYPINTFPGEIVVKINGKELTPGIDFLVDPSSCSEYGKFQVIWYNEASIPSSKKLKKLVERRFFNNKFVVLDESLKSDKPLYNKLKNNELLAAGVIELNEKLTHHLSTMQKDFVTLNVRREIVYDGVSDIEVEIEQKFIRDYTSQNVIGVVPGADYPDSIVVVSAHYDHLGKMGNKVYFPGANDNASGVAMMLNLAKHYGLKNKPKKTMVFIAFGAEESGIIGSKYFTENPTIELDNINFVLNLDLMGTGSEGIQVVNGKVFRTHFDLLTKLNDEQQYLKEVKIRGKAANSDHYWFSEKGIPAFFIYTLGGIKAYHDVFDISETLPLTKFEDCFRLFTSFIEEL